ncbi:cytoskeletal protein binding protein [Lithohypha guttulata]|uniref:cytoskeletal protein binding protein n=1 Tax=Lithohypha guttulata TaxID=1690604 RepID=UPI00315C77F1
MGFLAVCTALYDYQPQSEGELELKEGDILYILEKSTDDDWWKAKKRAVAEDEDEPEGLIPYNYVEDTQPIHNAKALYDYTRQTEEEVSFSEDAAIQVYDTSDPDWTLVSVDDEFGFAPANYIEITTSPPSATHADQSRATAYLPSPVSETQQQSYAPASPIPDPAGPNARLANIIGGVTPAQPPATRHVVSPPLPPRQSTPDASDEDQPPPKPQRPQSQVIPVAPPAAAYDEDDSPGIRASGMNSRDLPRSPGGFHLYNISEMVSAMGKRKKMPITLGLNIATGTIMLSPEKSRDGPTQEWTADKLEHYSIEGKHVFLELNRPSRSLDLHAGAKDTAREIVTGLGDIAGAHRAEGLKEVITAASGGAQRKGIVLYDFMAQGEDEVTVAEGDEVIVLDDTKSEEWWNVRRIKNGKEGVVPSSYVEITGIVAAEPASRSGINAGLSPVEQNRLEEERLAKEAARADRARRAAEEARAQHDGLPERGSSLAEDERRSSKKDKKPVKSDGKSRSKPDASKVRTWTDHSGSFKVDAQFLGVADGKIHLHKVNGVKIAVPVSKMSPPDLAYVEKVTNESIDEHIPLADLIKMKRRNQDSNSAGASITPSSSGTRNKMSDYDWFEFFLNAGVGPHQCERYAQAMTRDSMDESVLPDIQIETLRTLGLKEGDALKVMKYLDQRFGRTKVNGEPGGLFSNADGGLKDNTRKRPDANRTTADTVDASVLQSEAPRAPSESRPTPLTSAPVPHAKDGFDDDAWTPKPSRQPVASPAPAQTSVPAVKPPSANMQALSLLDQPLEPTPAPPRPVSQASIPPVAQSPQPAPQQLPSQTGATPQLFQQVGQALQVPQTASRQRPQAPQQNYTGSALLAPPPRPLSAPQNAPQNQFNLQPLQAQMTGVPTTTHPAPAGQSLGELTAQRMQQYLRPQQTAFMQPGMQLQNGFQPQATGFLQQQQFGQPQQPYLNGNATGSPFADPRTNMLPQPTGFGSFQQTGQPQGGINSMLPPALTPQRTGFPQAQPQLQQQNGFNQFQPQQSSFPPGGLQPQPTGFQPSFQPQSLQPQPTGFQAPLQTGFGQPNGFGANNIPPLPPMPQQSTPAPLIPQKTAAPEVRFGTAAPKLQPQPTGRRANLAHATPQNPFGF